jgi:hypothetical protein
MMTIYLIEGMFFNSGSDVLGIETDEQRAINFAENQVALSMYDKVRVEKWAKNKFDMSGFHPEFTYSYDVFNESK